MTKDNIELSLNELLILFWKSEILYKYSNIDRYPLSTERLLYAYLKIYVYERDDRYRIFSFNDFLKL